MENIENVKEIITIEDVEKSEIVKDNAPFFGIGSIIYGVIFCFCIYQNFASITLPILCACTLYFMIACLKKLDYTMKKYWLFFVVSIMLLSIATFLTDNNFFIFFNYVGIICLYIIFVLYTIFDTSHWVFSTFFFKSMAAVFRSIVFFGTPFSSLSTYIKEKQNIKSSKGHQIFIGVLISIPLLFIVMGLMMSADLVFYNMFEDIVGKINISDHFFGVIFYFLFGFVGFYTFLANTTSLSDGKIKDKKNGAPLIAVTFLSIITAVYLIFCYIQIFYLFTGLMTLPKKYTFASYAREGFFQLLFLCIINLIIVLVTISRFRNHPVLTGCLTVFCCCTFIIIASSAYRMLLYISAYELTLDRVLVLWTLLVLTFLMILVLITVYKNQFPLFMSGVVVVTFFYILLSFSRPDYFIAYYNIYKSPTASEKTIDRRIDTYYLYDLSADAAPILNKAGYLRDAENDEVLTYSHTHYMYNIREKGEKMNIRRFNVSRYIAYKLVGTGKKS